MTNTDVEDVLASIRRLVSDNPRPGAPSVQQPPSDRLVLTPSLRVTEHAAPDEPVDDGPSKNDAPLDTSLTANGDDWSGEDALAGDSTADAEIANDTDAPAGENVAMAGREPSSDVETDALPSDGTATSMPEDAAIAAVIAKVETDEDAGETPQTVPEDWAQDVEEEGPFGIPEPKATEQLSASQSLSDKIAALETLVGARRDQFEPDQAGADAYAGTQPPAMAWEDVEPEDIAVPHAPADAAPDDGDQRPVTEPETDATPQVSSDVIEAAPVEDAVVDAEPDHITPASDMLGADDETLDEDALRELISDIVREELQGALGERITRNVRKLVRREIHRALTAQELE
ncbi:MAG: hypothetical protein AAF727_03880 [Pseudomonadota bacterium]